MYLSTCEAWWHAELPAAPFPVGTSRTGRIARVTMTDALDLETVPRLLSQLGELSASTQTIILDLARIPYIDSDGIRALLFVQEKLEKQGKSLRVMIQPGGRVERTLSILKLTERFRIDSDITGASTVRNGHAGALAA